MTKSKSESSTDTMTDTARKAAEDLKETGREALEGAKTVMGGAMSDLRSGAAAKADEVREVIAEEGSRMARSLHEAAGQYGGGVQSRVLDTMASGLDSVSRTIATRDAESLMSDVQSFARRNPALFIAGAAVAGIVLVRLAAQSGRSGEQGIGGYGQTGTQAGDMGSGLQSGGMGGMGGGMSGGQSGVGGRMGGSQSGSMGGQMGGMSGDPVIGPDDGGMMGEGQGSPLRDDDIPGSRGPSTGGNL